MGRIPNRNPHHQIRYISTVEAVELPIRRDDVGFALTGDLEGVMLLYPAVINGIQSTLCR